MSEWTKVDDRLPERDGENSDDVLVWFQGGDSKFEIACFDYEAEMWVLPNKGFDNPDCWPDYWMPLPPDPGSTGSSVVRKNRTTD